MNAQEETSVGYDSSQSTVYLPTILLFKSIQSIFNVLSGVRIALSSYHKMRTLESKLEKGRMVVVSF